MRQSEAGARMVRLLDEARAEAGVCAQVRGVAPAAAAAERAALPRPACAAPLLRLCLLLPSLPQPQGAYRSHALSAFPWLRLTNRTNGCDYTTPNTHASARNPRRRRRRR